MAESEPLECGAFALSGEPATLSRSRNFSVGSGSFMLLGEPAYLFVSYPVPLVAIAKFSWHMQGLSPIVAAPARATFYWKV